MTCVEYLDIVTKQAARAMSFDGVDKRSIEQLNDINNSFQLRSIAYSLAVIADKLSEEKINGQA